MNWFILILLCLGYTVCRAIVLAVTKIAEEETDRHQKLNYYIFALVLGIGGALFRSFGVLWFLKNFLDFTKLNYWTIFACLLMLNFFIMPLKKEEK